MRAPEKGAPAVKLPNMVKPCKDCPFRKSAPKGWLGRQRMTEILHAESFVCHKHREKQCAGHMLIKGEENTFVMLAKRLNIPVTLSGQELVFDKADECIDHHHS